MSATASSNRAPIRIGVVGGTFDPVHVGHLQVAETVMDMLHLDRVLLSPTAQPWHKTARNLAPAEDRVAMLKLALHDHPRLELTTVDIERGGNTYTIDTLRDLAAEFSSQIPGRSIDWYFITGADAIAALATWKSPEELLAMSTFIAVSRPGYKLSMPDVENEAAIRLLDISPNEVSSSAIRGKLHESASIAGLVPDPVAEYIYAHHLYGAA